MARPRGVKFQHRANGGYDIRRPGSSTSGESTSELTSPSGNGDIKTDGAIQEGKEPVEPSDYEKKKATFITRTIWSIAMIGGFSAALFSGHIYILITITAIQIICFKEVIAIAQVPNKQRYLPLTKSLNWYFLVITMYWMYGESVIYYFKHILLVDKVLLPLATHHRFISFTLYIMGECWRFPSGPQADNYLQASSSSSLLSKRAITDFSSRNSPGPIWLSTLLSFRDISP
jgi:phosphatidate cytidylyltransferase